MKGNTPMSLYPPHPEKCKVLACATVIEEMLPLIPPLMKYEVLEFGLHTDPKMLKRALQEAVDSSENSAAYIILGYGLCSQAVVGLRSEKSTLVLPRVDDCIGLFLGSMDGYRQQLRQAPGTYYLTKGWLNAGDTPFDEYDRLEKLYGPEKARGILSQMFKNYTRLALINTGQYRLDEYREKARSTAQKFDLQYEEVPGSDSLLRAMLYGPWDDRLIVVPPGNTISFFDFRKGEMEGL
jgi:hypothetical protein